MVNHNRLSTMLVLVICVFHTQLIKTTIIYYSLVVLTLSSAHKLVQIVKAIVCYFCGVLYFAN